VVGTTGVLEVQVRVELGHFFDLCLFATDSPFARFLELSGVHDRLSAA
jgi:hypothetical protein